MRWKSGQASGSCLGGKSPRRLPAGSCGVSFGLPLLPLIFFSEAKSPEPCEVWALKLTIAQPAVSYSALFRGARDQTANWRDRAPQKTAPCPDVKDAIGV